MNNNTIGNITVDELHEYVSLMASKIAKMTVEENSVVTGTITASVGNNYTIQLKTSDSQSSARPLTDGTVYNVGDYVYLIRGAAAIEGGESPSYFIFGRVDDTNEAFANASDLERFNPKPGGIVRQGTNFSLGDDNTYTFEATNSNEDFWTALKNEKALKIEGLFTSPTDNSDFGIRLTYFYFKEGKLADGADEVFELNRAWMQGQPGNIDSLYQTRVIERGREFDDFDKLKVEVFGTGTVNNIVLTAGTLNKYLKDFSLEVKPTNKSYFFNEPPVREGDDTVRLEARLKYLDGAINSGVQYYWFVEMPKGVTVANLADGDKAQVNRVGGDRWYCLNSYNDCDVVGQDETIRIWNKSDNFTLLDKFKYLLAGSNPKVFYFDKSQKIPFKFVNKIKCVAVYEGFYINSKVFELVDYSCEQYSVKLVPNEIEPHNIVSTTDFVEFTCEVTNDNPHSGDLTPIYNWYKVNSELEPNKNMLIISSTNKPVLRAHGGNPSDDEKVANYKVDNSSQIYFFYCKVEFKKDEVVQFSETTEKVKVTSYLGNTLVFTEKYKYYISQNSGVIFNPTDDLKKNVWTILDDSIENESWTDIANKEAIAIQSEVFNNKHKVNTNGSLARWYLYYTYQQITTVKGSDEIIDSTEWSRPIILRIVEYRNGKWTDIRSSTEVSQLNTFNELTNNGEDEGIYYTDVNEYILTSDKTAIKDKIYYLKEEYALADNSYFKLGFKDEITYYQVINNTFTVVDKSKGWVQGVIYYKENANKDKVKCGEEDFNRVDFLNSSIEYWIYTDGKYSQIIETEEAPREFVPGTEYYVKGVSYRAIVVEEGTSLVAQTYYEKTDSKSHLYINATYINTGTLSVGQGVNEKFYASIHNPEVRIAGFTVDKNSINNNETGDKQLYFGQEGLQLGTALNTTIDENGKASVTISGDITVTNGTGSDGTLSGVFADLKKQISAVDANKIMIDTVTEYYVINNVSELPEDPDEWKNDKENFDFDTDIQTPTNEQPYLWNYEVTTYTGSKQPDSTTPVIIAYYTEDGKKGDNGWSIDSITNWYAVSNKNSAAPERGEDESKPTSPWSTTPGQISSETPYLWNYEVITYSGGEGVKNPTITEPALIGSRGDDGSIEITQADTVAYYCEGSSKAPDQQPPSNPNNGNTGKWLIEASFFGGQGWFGRRGGTKAGEITYVWKTLATQVDAQLIFSTSAVRLSDMEAVELAAKHWIVSTRYIKQNQDGTWKFPEMVPSNITGAVSILDPLTGDSNNNYTVPEGDIGRWCYLYDRTIISGGAIVTGSITTDKLKVNSLEAVSSTMGILTAGEIQSLGWSKKQYNEISDWPFEMTNTVLTDFKDDIERGYQLDYTNCSITEAGYFTVDANYAHQTLVIPLELNGIQVTKISSIAKGNTLSYIFIPNISGNGSAFYWGDWTADTYANTYILTMQPDSESLKSQFDGASQSPILINANIYYNNSNWLIETMPALISGWRISTSGDYFIESENFTVSYDGEVFGTKGLFSGDIASSTVNSNTFAATISSSAPLFECLATNENSTTIFPAYYVSANSSRLKILQVETFSIQKDSLQCDLQPLLYNYGDTASQSVKIDIYQVESIDTGVHFAADTIQFKTSITATEGDMTQLQGDITVSLTVRYENIVGGSTTKTLTHVFTKGNALGEQDMRWIFDKETWAGILIARYNSHSWTPRTQTITYAVNGLSYTGIAVTNNLLPGLSSLSLGGPKKAWNQIYCTELDASEIWTESDSGNSSDLNKKHSINLLSAQYSDLFDNLQPVTYMYNHGTSNRIHTGFIAQDVLMAIQKAGLTTQDFAGYVEKSNEFNEIERYLRYGEFIALCVDQIQKLKKRVGELETQLIEIKGE